MKTLNLRGTEVKVYDSIRELPILRHHEYQKLAAQDVSIGSDMNAVNAHFSTLHKYLQLNQKDNAMQEAMNLHNNIYYMIEKISVKSLCLVPLIHSINHEQIEDFSAENAIAILNKLSKKGLTYGMLEDVLEDVKKNLARNLNPTFLVEAATLPG